jgi:type II secretion system protein G
MQKKTGFTLIELLVVISIIAILVAILLPNMMGARERAADSKLKNDLTQMKSALRLYYNDNQSYPLDSSSDPCDSLNAALAPYISNTAIPQGNQACRYTQTLSGDGFTACIPLQVGASADATASRNKCGITDVSTQMGGNTADENWYCICAE